MYNLIQTRILLPVVLTLLQIVTCSAKSVSPKHPLRIPSLPSSSKHDLVKDIVTSKIKVNVTSPLLANQSKASKNSTILTSSEGLQGTSQERYTSKEDVAIPDVVSHDDGARNKTLDESNTQNVTSSSMRVGNLTSHLTAKDDDEENKKHRVDSSPPEVVDGCFGHRCSSTSRCDASEGLVPDTGLPYMCRCPKDYFGIFCTIPRALACENCTGAGLYCHRTSMHWSGHFCYDMTRGWSRVGTGSCGGRDVTCDGGLGCVPPAALCDGIYDCVDETDENVSCHTQSDSI